MREIEKKQKTDEIKFRPRELRELVLRAIGESFVIGGSLLFMDKIIALGGLIMVMRNFKDLKIPKEKIIRVLYNLQKKDLIDLEQKGDEIEVKIKSKGFTRFRKYSIRALLDFKLKNHKWQGKWILVIFDIPEDQRNKRDQLRRFLDQMGFYKYQQSVYIFPFECREEISLIKKIVEADRFVKYLIADEIEGETDAKRFFKLNS